MSSTNGWPLPDLQLSAVTLSLLVIVAGAIAHVALRWWLRRRARSEELSAGSSVEIGPRVRRWISRGLREVVPPLALLIWIHGFHLALGLLLRDFDTEWAARAASALDWIYRLLVVVAVFWLLQRIGRLVEAFLTSLASKVHYSWDDVMLPLAGKAVRQLLPLLALILAAPMFARSPALEQIFRNAMSLLLIGSVASLLVQMVNAATTLLLRQYAIDRPDNLHARAVQTQVMVLKKAALVVIAVFTLASMLMVFESVRQFGASILASAGIAGIIIGLAAQRSIATLLAGFQLAMTQPIRVDDVVIVEGEWGRIEDITLTYVVVRIWDLRRLILPITYFLEQPFQNWTRTSADILGTVFLHVDYTVPLDALRAELTRILQASQYWDGKVNVLQVTDLTEHTMQVRALMSAADASLAWNLRCEVREGLVTFIQREYPQSLPRFRATIERAAVEAA
ncbi:MAG TPA: mechanosensitive ion channel domain-containing protein [Vicinamibacterales bacterium]